MRENTTPKDYKTKAYVLKRTNFGEADRILNLITPEGKVSAIARGARKEKSKLAGGIEIFSLVELNLHLGKSDLAVVTGAKLINYYDNILKDYGRTELAGRVLKTINRLAEHSDNPDYFKIVDQCLRALNAGVDSRLIRNWFILNSKKAKGEEVNLYRDTDGNRLTPDLSYIWDSNQEAFSQNEAGGFGASEIKMLRILSTSSLDTAARVKLSEELMTGVTDFVVALGDA